MTKLLSLRKRKFITILSVGMLLLPSASGLASTNQELERKSSLSHLGVDYTVRGSNSPSKTHKHPGVTQGQVSEDLSAEELLKACDGALVACEESLESIYKVVDALTEINDAQSRRIGDLEAERDSFWNNPFIWLGLGIAAGVTTGVIISK